MVENINEDIKRLVIQYLENESDWLASCFKRAKSISAFRKPSEAYGFEWAPHTAFANFLIQNKNVSELKIGQKADNGEKYDLRFRYNTYDIVIELKTVPKPEKIDNSYVRADIKKKFPNASIPYLLVFSYPSDNEVIPKLNNTTVIKNGVTQQQFRYYLYKISEQDA